MKSLVSILIVFSVVIISCKKEKTKEEILTNGSWMMIALTTDPPVIVSGVVITDWYSQLLTCQKDNVITFNQNKTYKIDEGATKCDTAAPQYVSGNWRFTDNEKVLIFKRMNDSIRYDILNIEKSMLKMNYSSRDTSTNILHTYTITFENR
jgi:hypothetical protein